MAVARSRAIRTGLSREIRAVRRVDARAGGNAEPRGRVRIPRSARQRGAIVDLGPDDAGLAAGARLM
jgi:hypothetical protein